MPYLVVKDAPLVFSYDVPGYPVGAFGRIRSSQIADLPFGIPSFRLESVMANAEGTVEIRDYGADDTGVSDSTAAINAALDEGYNSGKLVVGFGGVFRISGTVNIRSTCDFLGSTFVGDSGVSAPVVRIADDDAFLKRLRNIQVRLPKIYKDTAANMPLDANGDSTWPYDDDGVLIEGLSRSVVWFDLIHSVRNGIHIRSTSEYNTGTDFNQFFITEVDACQTNLWLDVTARDTEPGDVFGGGGVRGGWINENRFYGGCLRHERCDTGGGVPLAGVTQIKVTGFCTPGLAYGRPGANTFDYIGIEGNVHEYAIIMEGEYNTFSNCRIERQTPFPPEKVMLRVPANYPSADPSRRYAHNNVFRLGHAWWRLFDSGDPYGSFEKVNYTAGTGDPRANYLQDTRAIGDPADLGAGWVEV